MVECLIKIENLKKHFPLQKRMLGRQMGVVKALDGISFSIREGGSFGLVGESGSGKTTAARAILRLIEPTEGKIQMIFQDPHSSLNPRKTVFRSVGEPLLIHERIRGRVLRERVRELLEIVGLKGEFMFRYPHELSGGQKQRVVISRALSLHPKLLILDEPTSALDVSVQAQMLAFLESLQKQFGLTYLFISHNLAVIRHTCEAVGVMYLGKIIELGSAEKVFSAPKHPYTRALVAAVPIPQADQTENAVLLEGDIPSATNIPPGCRFNTRCPEKIGALCEQIEPWTYRVADGSEVACHLYRNADSGGGARK